MPSGKGQRLIVVHAGGVEGWVEGADLVFRSKTNSTDYHDEMNSEHYMEWFTKQLLPNIRDIAVIVVDNATFHNKQKDKPPTTANKKDDIKRWLDEHNIQYNGNDIKKTLLDKVKHHRPKPLYLTDDAATQHGYGHTVLRLPVAHCELNPIELAWASVKSYVAKHNKNFNITEIQRLTTDRFTHTTADMWRRFCRHVVDIENDYIQKDGLREDTVEEMIINIGEDDSDDETDDDDDDLIDENDRRLIDDSLKQFDNQIDASTSTAPQTETCINVRRDLLPTLQNYDSNFLDSVLPKKI